MSGKIPQDFIDNLVTRIDIVDIIDNRVPLKKAGHEYKACCPFHNEKTPSFTVSPSKQFYHCFGCGAHGTALGFLMDYERLSFVEAVHELANLTGQEVPTNEPFSRNSKKQQITRDLFELLEQASHYYCQQLKTHAQKNLAIDYLQNRGISGETAKIFEIGYSPEGWHNLSKSLNNKDVDNKSLGKKDLDNKPANEEHLLQAGLLIRKDNGTTYDRFRERIMFPIRNKRGKIIGFGGRTLDDGTPKYLNSPETELFHKGHELYGLYQARKTLRDIPQLLVVEGYMDVISLAQHGIPYSVATLGTAATKEHIVELTKTSKRIIFCFDGDRAGRQAAWKALETSLPLLDGSTEFYFMFLPDGEDPDSMIKKEGKNAFIQRHSEAQSLSEFLLQTLSKQANLKSIDGRAKLVEITRPYIEKIPGKPYQNLLINRLSELVALDARDLFQRPQKNNRVSLEAPQKLAKVSRTLERIPSLISFIIEALLHMPALATTIDDINKFSNLSLPGVKIMQTLVEFLAMRPHITMPAIIEHWRHTPEGEYLAALASKELYIQGDELALQFKHALERLEKQTIEQKIEYLLAQSGRRLLTSDEKNQLNTLLLQKNS